MRPPADQQLRRAERAEFFKAFLHGGVEVLSPLEEPLWRPGQCLYDSGGLHDHRGMALRPAPGHPTACQLR